MKDIDSSIFKKIFLTHYLIIIILVIDAVFWTKGLIPKVIQYILAVAMFFHNLDDKRLVNLTINYYAQLKHKLTYDELTGIYNRFMVFNAFKINNPQTVIMIDIDKFSKINDVYGSIVGNAILLKVANILKKLDKYSVFRFNGDVFIVCTKERYNKEDVIKFIDNITKEFNTPAFKIDGKEFFISFTYGISLHGRVSLEDVEMALNNAKELNLKYYIYHKADKNIEKSQKFFLYRDKIREAIINNDVIMFYQPIFNINLKIVKYEALIRIKDKDSYLLPYLFLDIAVQAKQYDKLSYLAITQAITQAKISQNIISINFSYRDIINKVLLDDIEDLIIKNNIAEKLVLEILESEDIKDYKFIISFINRFKKLGCKIALDDYGSGYSSFEHILNMDLDYIKIDASLIKDIDKNKKSQMIVQTIVDFTKKLNITTVAEYVATKEIYETCKDLGIDEFQGYYFAKPQQSFLDSNLI